MKKFKHYVGFDPNVGKRFMIDGKALCANNHVKTKMLPQCVNKSGNAVVV